MIDHHKYQGSSGRGSLFFGRAYVYFAYQRLVINGKIEVMKEIAVRLKKGDDLKGSLARICKEANADTAVVLSGVGSLYEARIRLANADSFYEKKDNYEIVSLTGTISKGRVHVHISLSDEKGDVIGGHLCEGCLINTTCELVLAVLEEHVSSRRFDEDTGYDEIVFEKVR